MNSTRNNNATIDNVLESAGLPPAALRDAARHLDEVDRPRMRRWWNYYRNPTTPLPPGTAQTGAERPYRQAQEWGLPARITGFAAGNASVSAERAGGIARKEVVVENDIGWRVDAMVDHLFGRELFIDSAAADPSRRAALSALLRAILHVNGGIALLQQAAVLGMVHGFVDVVVKLDDAAANAMRGEFPGEHGAWQQILAPADESAAPGAQERGTGRAYGASGDAPHARRDELNPGTGPGTHPDGRLIERLARLIRFEIVHPSHALPLPASADKPDAYARIWESAAATADDEPAAPKRWWHRALPPADAAITRTRELELLTATRFLRVSAGTVLAHGEHSLGELPVVHIQNLAMPFEYAGRSDVEALLPLQDELNTRLSDRAYRITMQSFKMFLGKGVDNFLSMPVGPGRMWATDNQDAEIKEFGGDERCPSEELHIAEIREAMDKTSGVPPVAAGLIRDRVGQLSSAAALRVTLQSLLAKTERKRATYGRGIAEMLRLALAWLDVAGLLPTTSTERAATLTWPSPLPENAMERLREAEIKARLGVPIEQVRREIGY